MVALSCMRVMLRTRSGQLCQVSITDSARLALTFPLKLFLASHAISGCGLKAWLRKQLTMIVST